MDNHLKPKNKRIKLHVNESEKADKAIRTLRLTDLEAVAAMSHEYFPESKKVSQKKLIRTLKKFYFGHEFVQSEVYPLVSVSKEGKVDGFLGVSSNSYDFQGRQILVANCYHLMASEDARSRLVPMKLLQKFLSGPQDLSFADGSSESTRLLWKRLGGEPSIADSIYYKIPLHPISFFARPLLKKAYSPVRRTAHPMLLAADKIAAFLRVPFFHRKKNGLQFKYLSPALLLEGLSLVEKHYSLFPDYDLKKIAYLYGVLGQGKQWGVLQKVALLDEEENMVGWFMYYAKKRGISEVLQAVSIPGKEKELFEALTWHAYQNGCIELSGRLMTGQLGSQFTTDSVCMPARMWTLVHTQDKELKHEIHAGKAFLTRFEGDLWLL